MPRSPATMAVSPAPSVACASLGELVADAVHRQHVARICRLRLDLAPQILDVRIDRALERLDRLAPNRIEQLRAGEHAPRLPCQRGEQLELGRRQVYCLVSH